LAGCDDTLRDAETGPPMGMAGAAAASLPRNPSGKLLKRQLREPYWKGRERRIN